MTYTPINPPETMEIDKRDIASFRARILDLEEKTRANEQMLSDLRAQMLGLHREFTLFMRGSKERFDVLSLLLGKFAASVDKGELE